MFVGLPVRAYIVWAAHLFLDKSLKTKYVIQRRLNFVKAVRFGRYVLNGLVRWASCEGLRSSGRTSIFRGILEITTCDPASIGFFDAIVRTKLDLLTTVRFWR